MIGWHHQLNGHEFEQAPGVGDGQGSLACCSSWVRKESDPTKQLNRTALYQFPRSQKEPHYKILANETEDEMVGLHHQLDGHQQTLGVSEGQGSLTCCSPWGHKELDVTEQLNSTEGI